MSGYLNIEATVTGEQSILTAFDRAMLLIRARVSEALVEMGEETAFLAAGFAPRKTGALAGSIRARLSERRNSLTETISPGKFYGRILERGSVYYGTAHNKGRAILKAERYAVAERLRIGGQWRVRPHPFMAPAEQEMRGRVDARLRIATDTAIAEAAK